MAMEVLGLDRTTECYRVAVDVDGTKVVAWVPERLAVDLKIGARPSHQAAYIWMAGYEDKIKKAITHLVHGKRRARAPFDQITLVKEH